jgi:cellulose synthase/poly-beta-1,6-N-acetylglucosamine synthase-like glycosyltransferase
METLIFLLPMYLLLYIFYIVRLIVGYAKVKRFAFRDSEPKTTFSIVVPFRNEAANLPQLLDSIRNLDYPKTMFEVILIDDFSTDDSEKRIYEWRMANGEFHITLIESVRRTKSPKKDAIARAIPIVAHNWVVTTDADCTLPKNWLKAMNDYIVSHDVEMLAGPVVYDGKMRLSHHFQQMDLLSLQGATIGGFGLGKAFMCNGANFAYSKNLFSDLKGFAGNDNAASGDDVFLLHKAMAAVPKKVHYLKSRDAIVVTKPVDGWIATFFQRVRWGSKAVQYEHEFAETLAWAVFLGNASLVALFCFALAHKISWMAFAVAFGVKVIADLILLVQTNGFIRHGKFFFPLFGIAIYPVFTTLVALYSAIGIYRWKGRTLR